MERLTALMGSDLDPEGRAFATLADACLRAGEMDRAQTLVSEGTAKHPDFASGWVVAGRVYAEAGRDDEARAAWERVVKLDGENVPAILELAGIAQHSDDTERALELYRRAEHLDHTDPQVRARIELLESLPEEAIREPMVASELEMPAPEEPVVAEADPEPEPEPDPEPEPLVADPVPEADPEPEPDPDPEPDPMTVIDPQSSESDDDPDPPEDEPAESPLEGEMLTRTMAEVLVKQGLTGAAIDVYEKLAARDPDDASLSSRLAELKGDSATAPPEAADGVVSIDSLAPDR